MCRSEGKTSDLFVFLEEGSMVSGFPAATDCPELATSFNPFDGSMGLALLIGVRDLSARYVERVRELSEKPDCMAFGSSP